MIRTRQRKPWKMKEYQTELEFMNVKTVTSTSLDNKAHKQSANKNNVSMKPGRATKYNK